MDAVDLLDRLEADLGSVSLHSDSREHSEDEQTASSRSGRDRPFASKTIGSADTQDPTYVHAAATCLLQLLEALPEPLVEYRLYEAAIRCDSRDAAYEVLHSLNEVVRPIGDLLCSARSDASAMTVKLIQRAFLLTHSTRTRYCT